jgi:hypothetical protein
MISRKVNYEFLKVHDIFFWNATNSKYSSMFSNLHIAPSLYIKFAGLSLQLIAFTSKVVAVTDLSETLG